MRFFGTVCALLVVFAAPAFAFGPGTDSTGTKRTLLKSSAPRPVALSMEEAGSTGGSWASGVWRTVSDAGARNFWMIVGVTVLTVSLIGAGRSRRRLFGRAAAPPLAIAGWPVYCALIVFVSAMGFCAAMGWMEEMMILFCIFVSGVAAIVTLVVCLAIAFVTRLVRRKQADAAIAEAGARPSDPRYPVRSAERRS